MSDSPGQPRPRPTVEDLLRLKRAERPDPAFWQDFERGLHQKQLAAIVEPRPWWLGLSLLTRKVPTPAWLFASASAGAAALFALISITSGPDSPQFGFPGQVAALSPGSPAPASTVPPTSSSSRLGAASARPAASGAERNSQAVPAFRPERDTSPAATPVLMVAQDNRGDALSTQATLHLATANAATTAPLADAVTLRPAATADVAEPSLALVSPALADVSVERLALSTVFDLLASASDSLTDASPEPMGDLAAETHAHAVNPRHARLLAATPATEDSKKSLASARERVVHRLSDGEELYASITRVGVSGDRLSLRF